MLVLNRASTKVLQRLGLLWNQLLCWTAGAVAVQNQNTGGTRLVLVSLLTEYLCTLQQVSLAEHSRMKLALKAVCGT
jgi:hypothetical protein